MNNMKSRVYSNMRKRKRQVSKNNLAVSKPNKQSSLADGEIRYFDRIPVDLLVNILSKLPTKDIAKCRCVSKLWSSNIRIPNYHLLFPIKSPVTPRLLFAFQHSGKDFLSSSPQPKVFFYSSPQPQNPNENSSLVATHYDHKNFVYNLCKPVLGLVCCRDDSRNDRSVVVSNPMTGEYVTLPKLNRINKSKWPYFRERFSFAYDPIHKQFKVLHITWLYGLRKSSTVYRVLTLGTGKGSWRNIQCDAINYLAYINEICIDGVLYYPAKLINTEVHSIACFDVTSEKFSFINIDQVMATKISDNKIMMIDFKGKLGACSCDIKKSLVELWVLEDAEKHKWSTHIQHINGCGYCRVYTFPNYFEDVRFM